MQKALRDYWGPVYSVKSTDTDAAHKFLAIYVRRNGYLFQFEALDQPEVEDFVETIKRSKESACGPDGIPHSAYKAHAELSGYVVHQTNMELEAEAN